jgi:hypothetical protein
VCQFVQGQLPLGYQLTPKLNVCHSSAWFLPLARSTAQADFSARHLWHLWALADCSCLSVLLKRLDAVLARASRGSFTEGKQPSQRRDQLPHSRPLRAGPGVQLSAGPPLMRPRKRTLPSPHPSLLRAHHDLRGKIEWDPVRDRSPYRSAPGVEEIVEPKPLQPIHMAAAMMMINAAMIVISKVGQVGMRRCCLSMSCALNPGHNVDRDGGKIREASHNLEHEGVIIILCR